MALRNGKVFILKPKGLSDAIDGSDTFLGAMTSLSNLIPNPGNDNQFVPRAASVKITNFAGFSSPMQVTALTVIGNLAWGMISTSRYAGHDEPFCYNISTGAFIAIGNVTSSNTPSSPATTGDWTPPCIVASTGTRLTITHPGYDGVSHFIGWIDFSSFSSTSLTGTTYSSTLIDTLSADVLSDGWEVGYKIAGVGIPANTYIVSIAADGLSLVMSNAATSSGAGVALTVTGGTPAAPVYGAGQINGSTPFPAVPMCCGIFNSRTYYGVLNYLQFSDTLNPQQMTNSPDIQVLTIGDNTPVTAIAQLPLTSQVTGGIIQSLIIFKGAGSFYQITGDAATSNLALNVVAGSVGTLAPNTITETPSGLTFVAPDGVRTLTFAGTEISPLGVAGSGVHVPFNDAVNPTRMCAAYNNNVLRISVQPLLSVNETPVEYWYDYDRQIWTGPHTFPNALIRPYYLASGSSFIHAASGVNGALWQSNADSYPTDTYVENGVPLQFNATTTLLPDNQEMAANAIVETSIGLQLPTQNPIQVAATTEDGTLLGQFISVSSVPGPAIWGGFNWGATLWGSGISVFRQLAINWSQPLVVRQMILIITGQSNFGFILGTIQIRYQQLGYQLPGAYTAIPPVPPV